MNSSVRSIRKTPPATLMAWLIVSVIFSVAPRLASAQLAVSKTYFAIKKPVEVEVSIPSALKGDAEIELFDRSKPEPVAKTPVLAGPIDLAALFPNLWASTEPKVLFAQLVVAGAKIGPPLVLQPMLTPQRATPIDPRGLSVRFASSGPAYFSGLRIYTEKNVVLQTSVGEIEIALRPDAAPNTAWNFRHLVEGGFYDGVIFHRVIGTAPDAPRAPQDPANAKADDAGFMIQTGDALGTGVGGPGYCIPLEKSTLKHDFGVVSMARLSSPDTAGSQFFICLSRRATASLDGAYASFAQVVRGAEVVRAIAAVETAPPDDRPLNPPTITRAKLVDAPPYGEGLPPEKPGAPTPR